MNEKVKIGDRIILLHMEDEFDISTKEKGTVKSITRDPFEDDDCYIIGVNWDSGQSLNLLSCLDVYRIIKTNLIEDTQDNNTSKEEQQIEWLIKNGEIRKNFNKQLIFDYLENLRQSGVINMFGSSPFLYSGKNWIERYYGEDPPNQEAFNKVLEMSENVKNNMIQGILKSITKDSDFDRIEFLVKKTSTSLVGYYMLFK